MREGSIKSKKSQVPGSIDWFKGWSLSTCSHYSDWKSCLPSLSAFLNVYVPAWSLHDAALSMKRRSFILLQDHGVDWDCWEQRSRVTQCHTAEFPSCNSQAVPHRQGCILDLSSESYCKKEKCPIREANTGIIKREWDIDQGVRDNAGKVIT